MPVKLRIAVWLLLPLLLPRSAAARGDFVQLELVDAARWPAGLAPDVERDLRAGLARQQIGLRVVGASSADAPAALAVVRLDLRGADHVRLSIQIRDAVTRKRVARDIDLSAVPRRGHSVTVAVAVEELLRASWAEIALVRAQRGTARRAAKPAPAVVRRSVARALRRDVVARASSAPLVAHQIGGRFASDGFGGGVVQLGGDAFYRLVIRGRVGIELAAGARTSLLERGALGTLGASSIVVGLAVDARVVELGRLVIAAGLDAQALVIYAFGNADAGGAAESAKTYGTASVAGRIVARLRLTSRLQLEALGRVGGVVAGVALQEDARTVTAIEGLAVSGAFALLVTL
ncbi:MAG: hypothetical protein KC503_11375 [Myxococcales bacterium]|nr:hypothetical protein [Myxococcales bacterium]